MVRGVRPAGRGQSFFLTESSGVTIDARKRERSRVVPRRGEDIRQQARERIAHIRTVLNAMEYLCSGTLLRRTKVCGKPSCRCAHDPSARHGPYYEWGHLKGGKLVHRVVSPEQAALLRLAIANYRQARKLLRAWEKETERLIDAGATGER